MIYPSPPALLPRCELCSELPAHSELCAQATLAPTPRAPVRTTSTTHATHIHATYTHRSDLLHALLSHRARPSSHYPTAPSRPPKRAVGQMSGALTRHSAAVAESCCLNVL